MMDAGLEGDGHFKPGSRLELGREALWLGLH